MADFTDSKTIQVRLHRLEQALRDCDRLAQIGRVSASIAHEIKNPLEAIIAVIHLLEHGPEEKRPEYLAIARREVERAVEIANGTLDFARDAPQPGPVKISRVLDDVTNFYRRKIRYKQINLDVRHDYDAELVASPGELRQIFSNLMVNSLEAVARERGVVKLHTFRCRYWKKPDQYGIRVVVADNGPGIPPEARQQIFEPFFTTKNTKGTGLGLWIVHSLVDKYGGNIRLRSSVRPERSGTCFSVFLPC